MKTLHDFLNEIKEVRAIIALVLVGAVVGGFFIGKIDAESVVQLGSVAIGFYFATKTNGNGNGEVK